MQTDNIGASFALTPEQPSVPRRVSRATWAGLAISLFAMVAIRQAVVLFAPDITFDLAVLKEALIWWSAVTLLVIIRRGEHLSLRSIGLGAARWWKSILWGFIIAVVSMVAVGALAYVTGYGHGLGRFWSVAIPLVIFSFGHSSGGAANILIAFSAGLILTGFYLWRRDLVANMIGHGLVDFVANVLPALFS